VLAVAPTFSVMCQTPYDTSDMVASII